MNRFMKTAVEEAEKGLKRNEGGPFGAVIVGKGKIIAKAHNKVLKTNDPTMHAEIAAIRIATKKLKRFNLSDCGLYSSCEPCPMCYSAIRWAKIKKIFFGCTRKDAEKIGFSDREIYDELSGKRKSRIIKKSLGREECLALFKKWSEKKDKTMY